MQSTDYILGNIAEMEQRKMRERVYCWILKAFCIIGIFMGALSILEGVVEHTEMRKANAERHLKMLGE